MCIRDSDLKIILTQKKFWSAILTICFNILAFSILLPNYRNNCNMEGLSCLFNYYFLNLLLVAIEIFLLFILILLKISTPHKNNEIITGISAGICISIFPLITIFLIIILI